MPCIGLDAAIENGAILSGQKTQALSCVGLAPEKVHKTTQSIETLAEPWQRVGIRSLLKTVPQSSRLMAARAAPADDVVRIKDEHCHDTSAWGDV